MWEQLGNNESSIWFTEYHTKNTGITIKIKDILYKGKSKFQEICIIDTFEFNKIMLLDNLIMFTERDEFVYHEMITHIPMNTANIKENVLIIGGGDCGTLRELSKYDSIKKLIMVEIDRDVVNVSKRFFPQLHKDISKKAKILFKDGIKYIKNTKNKFDLIIVDSTDPIGPGEVLFTDAFYKSCYNHLNKNGFLVIQAESPYMYPVASKKIYNRLNSIFHTVIPYLAYIPTYPSGMWQFFLCSKQNFNIDMNIYLNSNKLKKLKYYNKDIHNSSFVLPNFVKKIYDL